MNAKELRTNLELVLQAGLVPYIHGQPGIGKSDIVKQVAKSMGAYLIDMRLSQLEPQDLN